MADKQKTLARNVVIEGGVGQDAELRYTQSGMAVADFSVAVDTVEKRDDGSFENVGTEWIKVSAWRDLGEHVGASIHKGDRVVVTGTLKRNDYTSNEGVARTAIVLTADSVSVSLRFGVANYHKAGISDAGVSQAQPVQQAQPVAQAAPSQSPAPTGVAPQVQYQAPAATADLF